ncbi:MAG TPA: ACT domain-containing protein, partial [Alphaproteobacteria bacterium]|nr:ACT domain-containing protein [Alphaproteobacteria bacterium]
MTNDPDGTQKILTITCPDGPGIVAAVTGMLSESGANIAEAAQFGDPDTGRFFQRIVFDTDPKISDQAAFDQAFGPVAERFSMDWALHDLGAKAKAVIAVSKIGHCLADLLHRHHSGDSAIEICAVVSN